MKTLFADAEVGRKNILFGMGLFLLLGVAVGIPLTINFFGGSLLTSDQYQTWKVIHAYGVFLAFINYFLGLGIDRFEIPSRQKAIVSGSFLLAGVIGGVGRMILALLSSLNTFGMYVSLAETALFGLGAIVVMRGQMTEKTSDGLEPASQAGYSRIR